MDFEAFLTTAWSEHADDPSGVAARWGDGMAHASDEARIVKLAGLVHHVHGAHLGDWEAGRAALLQMTALPAYAVAGESGASLRRWLASLAVSAGAGAPECDALTLSDRIRVTALAAANLAERDTPRAARLFDDALALADGSGLAAGDPMNRALAVTGNNLACALEEKTARSGEERDLMVAAARAARRFWERAGTWLEVERAEYRLAMTWLQAGDPARARGHAQTCLDLVLAHDGPALERFFGWEARGLADRATGNGVGHAEALDQARAAFADLGDDDRSWCRASLDKLSG